MNSKPYSCKCPSGISGDQCESCTNTNETFRYQKREGFCADCGCSDLSQSQECDQQSGQCPCIAGGDIELAGRQCVSRSFLYFFSDVFVGDKNTKLRLKSR